MPDPRVVHYWDGQRLVGAWFAENLEGYQGVVWDAHYLYGPDAAWEDRPAPLVARGSTIYGERQALEEQVRTLLEP